MFSQKAKAFLVFGAVAVILLSGLAGYGGSYYALQQYGAISTGAADLAGFNDQDSTGSAYTNLAHNDNSAQSEELSITEIYNRVADSVVEITTESVQSGGFMGQYIASGAGSGVIVRADGYIITNSHVIAGAKDITVRLKNGESYAATLSGRDIRSDLAVLKIEATDLQPVTFGDSSSLTVGELAVVIGNPLGELGGTVTEGIISALDREIVVEGETMYLLQTSAAVNPGNSGGGLFNSRGQLVGLINAKSGGFNIEGLGFAIPVNTVQENMNQLIIHGYVTGRAALGVRLAEITDPEMAYYYQVDQPGVYILEAVEQNGLQNGDRIISIDGQVITETAQVRKIIDQHEVGDRVILRIDRHNSELALPITLVELIS